MTATLAKTPVAVNAKPPERIGPVTATQTGEGFVRQEQTAEELVQRGIPETLWRRCVRYHCGQLLNVRRTIGKSAYCSPECYRADNNLTRQFKAGRECRRCGRKARKKK